MEPAWRHGHRGVANRMVTACGRWALGWNTGTLVSAVRVASSDRLQGARGHTPHMRISCTPSRHVRTRGGSYPSYRMRVSVCPSWSPARRHTPHSQWEAVSAMDRCAAAGCACWRCSWRCCSAGVARRCGVLRRSGGSPCGRLARVACFERYVRCYIPPINGSIANGYSRWKARASALLPPGQPN